MKDSNDPTLKRQEEKEENGATQGEKKLQAEKRGKNFPKSKTTGKSPEKLGIAFAQLGETEAREKEIKRHQMYQTKLNIIIIQGAGDGSPGFSVDRCVNSQSNFWQLHLSGGRLENGGKSESEKGVNGTGA